MNHVLANERGLASGKQALAWADPLLDLPINHVNGFFLIGMLVKTVAAAWVDCYFDHHQSLGTRSSRAAEPSQRPPRNLLSLDFARSCKFSGHTASPLRMQLTEEAVAELAR